MDSITSRIQKLEKLMQGEIQEAGISDSLVHHQGLLDCLYVLFNECQTQNLLKNKYVYEFVKRCKYCSIFAHAYSVLFIENTLIFNMIN